MAAIMVNGPAVEPVSTAEAKAHLRIALGDEDALIGALIASARRVAEARTGLLFIAQRWTLFRDRWPDDGVIDIPLSPVREVTELGVFGEEGEKAVVDPAHYVVDTASRPARLLLRGSRQWQPPGRCLNGIAITVEAGFGETPQSVPPPLRQAVLMLVAHWYAHRGDEAAPGMPKAVDALLQPFREVRL